MTRSQEPPSQKRIHPFSSPSALGYILQLIDPDIKFGSEANISECSCVLGYKVLVSTLIHDIEMI